MNRTTRDSKPLFRTIGMPVKVEKIENVRREKRINQSNARRSPHANTCVAEAHPDGNNEIGDADLTGFLAPKEAQSRKAIRTGRVDVIRICRYGPLCRSVDPMINGSGFNGGR